MLLFLFLIDFFSVFFSGRYFLLSFSCLIRTPCSHPLPRASMPISRCICSLAIKAAIYHCSVNDRERGGLHVVITLCSVSLLLKLICLRGLNMLLYTQRICYGSSFLYTHTFMLDAFNNQDNTCGFFEATFIYFSTSFSLSIVLTVPCSIYKTMNTLKHR